MEYGSTFNMQPRTEKNLYFVSGRVAIKHVLKTVLNNNDACLIPNFLCESIREQFDIYDYYNIDNNFEIDIETLKSKILNKTYKILYIINIFGYIDNNITLIKELCTNHNIIIIEDFTHNIYSENLYGDICICSYRKSLPTPFGSIVIDNNNILNIKQNFYVDIIYIFVVCLRLVGMVLKNWFKLKWIWRNILVFCENNIDKVQYSGFDYLNIYFFKYYYDKLDKVIRQHNIKILHKNLKIKTLEKFEDLYFTYPIFVKNKDIRNNIIKQLIEKNIYCTYYWDMSFDKKNECNKTLIDNMLCIYIDQRYNSNDMIYISSIINNLIIL